MSAIPLSSLRRDGGTQPRASINEDAVAEYEAAMGQGDEFPPVIVFYDGTDHWLADGFHRTMAVERLGRLVIEADVRQGTRRDAVLFSVGANAAHGLRRTNADKRRAVQTLLEDAEWADWSNREIARRCGVSDPFVGNLRPAPSSANPLQTGAGKAPEAFGVCAPSGAKPPPTQGARMVRRGGKIFHQRTAGINAGRAETRAVVRAAASAGVVAHMERAEVQGVTPTLSGIMAAATESMVAATPSRPPLIYIPDDPPPGPAVSPEWTDFTGAVQVIAENTAALRSMAGTMPALRQRLLREARDASTVLARWIGALEEANGKAS